VAKVPTEPDLDDVERRMDGALQTLKSEFSGLRTGRASVAMMDPIVVEAYGSHMPLNQLATVNVPEPRMITIQVWDRSMVSAVEKAIRNSGLGINPVIEGANMRLPIPELNAERRAELAKVAAKYAEQAKIAVRNVRRDGMDMLKKMHKDGHVSDDDIKIWEKEVQDMTDAHVKKIDEALAQKEKEIKQV